MSSRAWKTATGLGWFTAGWLVVSAVFVHDETPYIAEEFWAPFWVEVAIFLAPAALLTGAIAISAGFRISTTRRERLVRVSLASIPMLVFIGLAPAAIGHVNLGGPYGKLEFWGASLIYIGVPAMVTVVSWRPWRKRLEGEGNRLVRSYWTPVLLLLYAVGLLFVSNDLNRLGDASCYPGAYAELEGTFSFLAAGLMLAAAIWALVNLARFRRHIGRALLSLGTFVLALPAAVILFLVAVLAMQGHVSC